MPFPEWWNWELELTPHVERRMDDRDFNEVELRSMPERAKSHHANHVEGRYVIETVHRARASEVVVEPDFEDRLLVVVTCYPTEADR